MENSSGLTGNDRTGSNAAQGGVFALGNFDGVHRGHHAVIQAALAYAREQRLPAHVLTFEPHPRQILDPSADPFRLTPAPVKTRLLKALGIDDVITLDFTSALAALSAEDFVTRVLIGRYRVQHIVAGFDFVFGHRRGGNLHNLRSLSSPHGAGVIDVPAQRDEKGEIISSSRARAALRQGDVATARAILGRPWSIAGTVEPGDNRGNVLGFPTANIALGEYLRPLFGVYTAMARPIGKETSLPGVVNIGIRPTVGGGGERLELHLFQPYSDLYGQEWEVELHHFIRPEQVFPDLEALRDQIAKDIKTAKDMLSTP